MLIGNVGKEPEIRYIDNGVCTAQISLATSTPGYTLQNGTQVPERTEWHRILLWRRLAEIVENMFIRVINFISKVNCVREAIQTKRASHII